MDFDKKSTGKRNTKINKLPINYSYIYTKRRRSQIVNKSMRLSDWVCLRQLPVIAV